LKIYDIDNAIYGDRIYAKRTKYSTVMKTSISYRYNNIFMFKISDNGKKRYYLTAFIIDCLPIICYTYKRGATV